MNIALQAIDVQYKSYCGGVKAIDLIRIDY